MRTEKHHGHRHHDQQLENGHRRGRGRREREGRSGRSEGAKTFRRARALAFLERLIIKREALKKQLETSELQTLHPSIVGELKAVEMIIAEYIEQFELHEALQQQQITEEE